MEFIESSSTTASRSVFLVGGQLSEDGRDAKVSSSNAACSFQKWLWSPLFALKLLFSSLFIPAGLHGDTEYWRFQAADSIQGMCSYLRGILAMQATLSGAMTTDAADADAASAGTKVAVSALAALFTFVLKDGASMLGSLCFSGLFSMEFDSDIRFWRLFADVSNDIGLTVEILAPLCGPRWFLLVSCCANLLKALCGVSAGATRVAIAQHFAGRVGNVAEVQAKEGAQETAVTFIGLACGLFLASSLAPSAAATSTGGGGDAVPTDSSAYIKWIVFGTLTVVHVLANYYAVRILALRRINAKRAWILGVDLGEKILLLRQQQQQQELAAAVSASASAGPASSSSSRKTRPPSSANESMNSIACLTPYQVAQLEGVLPSSWWWPCCCYWARCGGRKRTLVLASPLNENGRRKCDHTSSFTDSQQLTILGLEERIGKNTRYSLFRWLCQRPQPETATLQLGVSIRELIMGAMPSAQGDQQDLLSKLQLIAAPMTANAEMMNSAALSELPSPIFLSDVPLAGGKKPSSSSSSSSSSSLSASAAVATSVLGDCSYEALVYFGCPGCSSQQARQASCACSCIPSKGGARNLYNISIAMMKQDRTTDAVVIEFALRPASNPSASATRKKGGAKVTAVSSPSNPIPLPLLYISCIAALRQVEYLCLSEDASALLSSFASGPQCHQLFGKCLLDTLAIIQLGGKGLYKPSSSPPPVSSSSLSSSSFVGRNLLDDAGWDSGDGALLPDQGYRILGMRESTEGGNLFAKSATEKNAGGAPLQRTGQTDRRRKKAQ